VKPSILATILAGIFSLFGAYQPTTYHAPAVPPPSALTAAAASTVFSQQSTQHVITYTVQAKDTLSSIAQMFTVPMRDILAANNLSQRAILHLGEKLTIPNPQTAPATLVHQSSALATAPAFAAPSTVVAPSPRPPTASTFVTQDQFNAGMSALSNSLRGLVFQNISFPGSLPATGGYTNAIALSNRIDNLDNVTISNATVNGVSGLTAADIPSISLSSAVSGVLPVGSGGTGSAALASGNIPFGNGSLALATSSSLFWDNTNSRLGIGTSSPTVPLEIFGSNSSTNLVTGGGILGALVNSDQTNGNFDSLSYRMINSAGSEITGTRLSGVFNNHTAGAESADLAFLTRNAGVLSEKLRITGAGNVGIGTTSPFAMFSVAGQASAQNFSAYATNATSTFLGGVNFQGYVSGLTTSNISDLVSATTADSQQSTVNIATWGDSLTQGANVTAPYPADLAPLTGHYVFNGGIGGQTAAQIAARMLLDTGKYSWPAIIWSGRNDVAVTDPTAVEASIASMVSALTTPNYIILPVFNNGTEPSGSTNYTWITTVNSYLAATYGSHYLDAREYLVQNGLSAAGITPSTQDLADIANDIPPTDLRLDTNTVHLNNAGYAALAGYIAAHASLLYSTTTSPHFVTNANLQSLFSSPSSFSFVNSLSNYSINGNQILWSSPITFSTLLGNGAGLLFNSSNVNDTAIGYSAVASTTSSTISDTGVGFSALSGDYGTGSNTALGAFAMQYSATGTADVAVGATALRYNQSGTQNNAIGNFAMNGIFLGGGNTGSNNNAFGAFALEHNTSGSSNVAISTNSLLTNTSGTLNEAVGSASLSLNTTGSNNVAIGDSASRWNLSATNTVAIGTAAGEGFLQNFNAQGYVIIGALAGQHVASSSNYNVMVGFQSGINVTTGANNILIGGSPTAGNANLTTGSNNISIGHNISLPLATGSNQLNIQNILYGANNSGSAGTFSTGTVGVGATSTPWARFSIAGSPGGTIPLFTISSSTSGFATSTAFIVDKNGNVGIGTSSPTTALQINGSITPNVDNVFTSGNATYRWNAIYSSNGTIQTSDARLKTNIATTTYGLDQIMQLRPVSFTWIAQPQQGTQLGFIAQEVQPILPEIVNIGDDSNHTLGLTYTEFIPIIVKSIQQIASISDAFEANLVAWLGNASNGIGDLFAKNLYAQNQLCIDKSDGAPVCITGDQLAAVLASANQSTGGGSPASSNANPASTLPVITVNGNNPAIVQVGDTYSDLGATITGPQADLNLGIQTYLNGLLTSNIVIDTSQAATDTIDYVVTDGTGLAATSTRTVVIEAATSTVQ
jgi:LysM repeat protein